LPPEVKVDEVKPTRVAVNADEYFKITTPDPPEPTVPTLEPEPPPPPPKFAVPEVAFDPAT